jgi:hypothetical protein
MAGAYLAVLNHTFIKLKATTRIDVFSFVKLALKLTTLQEDALALKVWTLNVLLI